MSDIINSPVEEDNYELKVYKTQNKNRFQELTLKQNCENPKSSQKTLINRTFKNIFIYNPMNKYDFRVSITIKHYIGKMKTKI